MNLPGHAAVARRQNAKAIECLGERGGSVAWGQVEPLLVPWVVTHADSLWARVTAAASAKASYLVARRRRSRGQLSGISPTAISPWRIQPVRQSHVRGAKSALVG